MLQLKNIRKNYPAGDGEVKALRGVSLGFARNGLVAILGPSGCGKTTLLNIIGGLDQYTGGDLVINGRSTRHFKDRDWDAYRNHSIGFVFQNYNLIPHQSVLQNVELALTLSGVGRTERRRRAAQALRDVGLEDQLRKKPSQMSGGQMQRVAIARALVNNPDIILADEPTGALDTQTSVQVMDVLKEVARDRLVIMVTHNPELAERYANRIIKMRDGAVVSDSAPYEAEEQATAAPEKRAAKRERKPSMGLGTAFSLSLKNLISKRGRTLLTSFAGSVGIIGIALIFAVSQGLTAYIDTVQEDTLSSYPLTLQTTSLDMTSLMTSFIGNAMSAQEHDNDAVYPKGMVYSMVNALGAMEDTENDLAAFKRYIEQELTSGEEDSALRKALTGVQYTYDADLLVYTQNVDGSIIRSDAEALMQELMLEYFNMDMSSMLSMRESMGISSGSMPAVSRASTVWQEMLTGDNGSLISPVLEKQYDVVYGSWPTQYDEIVLVLDKNNEIADMTLYALGLKSKEDIDALAQAAFTKSEVEMKDEHWSYQELCDMEFRVILASDCFTYDEATGCWVDLRTTQAGLKYLYDNGLKLKVSGIVRPNEDAVSAMLNGTIGYTAALTEYIVEQAGQSAAVRSQLAEPDRDIFTGLAFRESTGSLTDAERAEAFRSKIAQMSDSEKAAAYVRMMCIPQQAQLDAMMDAQLSALTRAEVEQMMLSGMSGQVSVSTEQLQGYLAAMSDEELMSLVRQLMQEQMREAYAQQARQKLSAMSEQQLLIALQSTLPMMDDAQCALFFDEMMAFSDATLEENLLTLGYVDLSRPATINLYASTFEAKDEIEAAIARYNESVTELEQITYTDYVGLMMSSVTTIINAITYVLIAFVAISLVVSSLMIGVITLISVQERTREIGILRALGASKRNVSSMFSAETLMIGFAAGGLGVLVTYLLCLPINAIIQSLTGIAALRAFLPWQVALVLIAISMLLTLFAGIIPSRSAARKDPVVALRSE